ncbi:acyl-CoA synthetase [Amylibacter marinus]|uniref:Acyl-CoA synthetase n=1 Tax=Amylibacter marinus TaxID=1475483 RepID=A0ABQ5VXE6_9RHOB|nr:acetate--CoA ligase family protein [Amylibacter marinus]GLQ36113.1 acyl-CoA synthetase [Amylibacter marinus]
MTHRLSRLLYPSSIAVIGGGAWCDQVIQQSRNMGFGGEIWPVHPRKSTISDLATYGSISALPDAPDAVFIGVNRHVTIDLVRELALINAGGAVCFANGFSEASQEDPSGAALQDALLQAAGKMPILGPNCYGFINALDGALLWPDQHGAQGIPNGVAILTQSSNIAINLTMQLRAVPIAFVVTCGNMAQTSQAEIATALLDDPRITAIGLHVEGFSDLRAWEKLAQIAHKKGVPLVVLKVGASVLAQSATLSHTASLAGSDAGAQAFLDRLGIARVSSLPSLLETLKLLHIHGPLKAPKIASISCSGGEASLVADAALRYALEFPPLSHKQEQDLRGVVGPMIALQNPLDYNTYIWRDTAAMGAAWAAMTGGEFNLTLSIVDYPTTDAVDWDCATEAAIFAHTSTGSPFGLVATLPELLPLSTAQRLMKNGVVPFYGLDETLAAISACAHLAPPHDVPILLPRNVSNPETIFEAEAKQILANQGLDIPKSMQVQNPRDLTEFTTHVNGPFALKRIGLAHKSEAGAVRLNIAADQVQRTAKDMGGGDILIEEMISECVVELLVGVTHDQAHGYVLTLGAGGIHTEILRDTVSLLLPCTRSDVMCAMEKLRCSPLLEGYRAAPPINRDALWRAIDTLQSYVFENADTISEIEVNPLICTAQRAVAVDALIRKG